MLFYSPRNKKQPTVLLILKRLKAALEDYKRKIRGSLVLNDLKNTQIAVMSAPVLLVHDGRVQLLPLHFAGRRRESAHKTRGLSRRQRSVYLHVNELAAKGSDSVSDCMRLATDGCRLGGQW